MDESTKRTYTPNTESLFVRLPPELKEHARKYGGSALVIALLRAHKKTMEEQDVKRPDSV